MTYVPRREVTHTIANKFEAIKVLALECRRLNDEMRAREESTDRKITSLAIERLLADKIRYYDARERREQERSEAMINAAETLLDLENMEGIDFDADDDEDIVDEAEAAADEDAAEATGDDASDDSESEKAATE